MAYLGVYRAGDFYRHPSAADRDYALNNFPQKLSVLTTNKMANGLCIFGDANLDYPNEEGKIVSEHNKNFRLDLQGKAKQFDVSNVEWLNEPPDEYKCGDIAQFQVQFGYESQSRLTRGKGAQGDYLTKHSGALAGVMVAMRQCFTHGEFQSALQLSFNRIRDVGGEYYGVLMSNVGHPDDDRRWPVKLYWCPECVRLYVVKFKFASVLAQVNRFAAGQNGAIAPTIRCLKCGERLSTARNNAAMKSQVQLLEATESNKTAKGQLKDLAWQLDGPVNVPATQVIKHTQP